MHVKQDNSVRSIKVINLVLLFLVCHVFRACNFHLMVLMETLRVGHVLYYDSFMSTNSLSEDIMSTLCTVNIKESIRSKEANSNTWPLWLHLHQVALVLKRVTPVS